MGSTFSHSFLLAETNIFLATKPNKKNLIKKAEKLLPPAATWQITHGYMLQDEQGIHYRVWPRSSVALQQAHRQ